MLREKSLRKILVSSAALFTLMLIYLIPKDDTNLENIKQNLEYVANEVTTNEIYLINNHNMLAKTKAVVDNKDTEKLAKEIIEILIEGGIGENKIPSGFKSFLPSDTKIISTNYENNLLKVNFSKELLNINKEYEERMIEALTYSLTSIENIDNIIIYVENPKEYIE